VLLTEALSYVASKALEVGRAHLRSLGASWGPPGGLLGVSWGSFGGSLGGLKRTLAHIPLKGGGTFFGGTAFFYFLKKKVEILGPEKGSPIGPKMAPKKVGKKVTLKK
jgi:hypothetical protein